MAEVAAPIFLRRMLEELGKALDRRPCFTPQMFGLSLSLGGVDSIS